MTGLPSLAHLAGDNTARGGNPDLTWREYVGVIEDAITNHPRSLQTTIGPSELGTDCLKCLARKLAGVPQTRDAAWLPTIGTAVHAWLSEVFTGFNTRYEQVRFLVETRVSVGEVDGVEITGSADLFDIPVAEVTDWKITGATTLRKVRSHKDPGSSYRKQAHLYGHGFTRRGLPVDRVRVAFLPRNEPTLSGSVIWSEPYDESVALECIARADSIAKAIRAIGLDALLPSLQADPDCFDCPRYDTTLARPGHRPGGDLNGLLAAPTTPATPVAGTTAAA